MSSIQYDDLRRTAVGFLITDLNTAMTFVAIALNADRNPETKSRNMANARRAHDTVSRLRNNLRCTAEENEVLDEKLHSLKTALLALGESF